MPSSQVIVELQERDIVQNVSNVEELKSIMDRTSISVYCGFDPTARSLHVGSLIPLLALRRFQISGHRPIALIGGGTGLVGDPAGKMDERRLNSEDVVEEMAVRLKSQAGNFLDFDDPKLGALVLDNAEWLKPLNLIPFLRDVGKFFNIGNMLGKDFVRSRVSETGLSYTEFSYTLLQAYDFAILRNNHNCFLQIGGSDQWGNITSGIEYIRRRFGLDSYGLTFRLLTRADGGKFGKTEQGTVFLDTHPFDFYQFWINTSDNDIERYSKLFSMRPLDQILDIVQIHEASPEKRFAQKELAREMTSLVHGKAALAQAEKATHFLFESSSAIPAEAFAFLEDGACSNVYKTRTIAQTIPSMLKEAGIAISNREARQLMESGAISINGQLIKDPTEKLLSIEKAYGRYYLIRKGRKITFIIVHELE